ncbi:PmoA family protein [Candidatus Sumerlaeota bacterium]|nr:PmoA family protein [Candidatus Sumerlaeota bacterium]
MRFERISSAGSLVTFFMIVLARPCETTQPAAVKFTEEPGKVTVTIGKEHVAAYVYGDSAIGRPYFSNVRAPGGIQVTRNHPPIEGKDPTDHATMHPGIWMAFGDLSGGDYWRNKSKVVHDGFAQSPTGGSGKGVFAVRNGYAANGGEAANCRETCRFTFSVRPFGFLLLWDSTFSSDQTDFYFGDQEEMGLGVRVATAITEKAGGMIRNADGLQGAKRVWGKSSAWCDYSGTIGGQHVGITVMCDPANFRPSWFHARDYGLLVANPFGRKAFGQGDESKVYVKRDQAFRLRYGILLHSSAQQPTPDLKAAFADFLELLAK